MAATCPIPPDEEERLKTLHDLDLLDVSYEPSFDRITSLCCQIFDVPIALVSLVDAERQFFKSQRGLGEVRETPRDLAFCAHAIMPDAPGFGKAKGPPPQRAPPRSPQSPPSPPPAHPPDSN